MKSFRIFDRRVGFLLSAFAFVLAVMAPSFVTATVSADQLLDRSVKLSSAAASATASYEVSFKVASSAAGFVIDFCKNSPLVGATCTAPTGFDSSGVTTATSGYTVAAVGVTTNIVKVVKSSAVSGGGTATFTLDNMVNPSVVNDSSNGFYARITTYTDSTAADGHTSATVIGSPIDSGGVAMAIVNTIGVSAAVLESMTFCVASATITENCANASSNLPSLTLGENTGGVKALSSSAVSTGTIYTQISTNAASGAIVRMKSSATSCGGLLRSGGGSACDIGPATTGGFSAGTAKFGVKTSAAYSTSGATSPTGTYQPVSGSGYNSSTYLMNYTAGNSAGVTSAYGDDFLDTNNAPVNNKNMDLTFGASISNNTPAGLYSTNISLIATGKF